MVRAVLAWMLLDPYAVPDWLINDLVGSLAANSGDPEVKALYRLARDTRWEYEDDPAGWFPEAMREALDAIGTPAELGLDPQIESGR